MPEPTQSFFDVLSWYGPITQYEPGPRRPIDRELRQLLHRHPGVGRPANHRADLVGRCGAGQGRDM